MSICVFTAKSSYIRAYMYLRHHLFRMPPGSMLEHNPNTLAYLDLHVYLFSSTCTSVFFYLPIFTIHIYIHTSID